MVGEFFADEDCAEAGEFAAADAAAELVELGEAEAFGGIDHHDAGVVDVDADFDDARGDEHLRFAGAEAGHRFFFFDGREAAVDDADAEVGEFAVGEAFKCFGDARGGDVFGFVDERDDDVGLAAGLEFAADEMPPLGLFGGADDVRADFLAAGRHVAEGRDVEVAEEGHADRARDGRGGHHQVVRRLLALAEGGALADAEFVLLVDDDEAELGEADVFLDDGVGADDEVDFAGGDFGEGFLAFAWGHAADQEQVADAAGFEERGECGGVLAGEDFGGGHEGGLVAAGDADEHGVNGDDGFAAADVALQEAVHRRFGREVGGDFGDGGALAGGPLEWEEAFDAGVDIGGGGEGGCAEADLLLPAAGDDGELQDEEFLEDEAAAGAFEFFGVARGVDGGECRGEGHEVVLCEEGFGEDFFQDGGAHFEGERDHAPQLVLREAFGERVERQEAHFGLVFFAIEPGDAGVGHFPAAAAVAWFCGEEDVLAFAEFFAHEGLVEPEGAEVVVALADEDADLAFAEAGAAAIDFDDFAADGLDVFFVEVGDGAVVGEVFVFAREEEDEVGGGADIEAVEERGAIGADAADEFDRRAENFGGGELAWRVVLACRRWIAKRACRNCTALLRRAVLRGSVGG